jgi:hypothetical protein
LSDFVKFQQDFVKIERMKYLQYVVVAYGTGNRDRALAGVAGARCTEAWSRGERFRIVQRNAARLSRPTHNNRMA